MIINIIGDVLLALLIFSMPKLASNAIIRIITTIVLCLLLGINNNKLIKKINTSYMGKEENGENIPNEQK